MQPSSWLLLTFFSGLPPPTATEPADFLPPPKPLTLSQTQSALFFLTKLKHNSLQRRKVRLPRWARWGGGRGRVYRGCVQSQAAWTSRSSMTHLLWCSDAAAVGSGGFLFSLQANSSSETQAKERSMGDEESVSCFQLFLPL